MALIKYGPTVSMIAGSIGGTTFARNRYGAYARNRTKPVDPGTNKQNEFRTRVSAAVAAWSVLTQAQQLKWNQVAKTTRMTNRIGESFNLSGINLFIRTYNLLDMAGITQVTVPPATPITQDYDAIIGVETDVRIYHQTISGSWPADAKTLIWCARDKTAATYFFKGPYEKLAITIAGYYVDNKVTIWLDADLTTKTSAFAMWRLVQADGAASHPRRMRVYYEKT